MTADNVQLLVGEPLQNIQWDINGGFTIAFKSFTIQVPLIRADAAGRSGIVHMNVTGTLLRDSGDEIRAAVSDRNLNEPTIEVDKAGVVRAIIANDDTLPEKPDQGLPGDGRERRPRVDNELPETPEPKKTGDAKK
jgi:hypothetical protein